MDPITTLQADVLRTLAHPRRLEILHELSRGPREVNRLAAALGLSQPNVSQHLAVLRSAGVVEAERDGREVHYRLADPEVMVACGVMRRVLERRLARLAELSTAAASPAADLTPATAPNATRSAPWTIPSTSSSSPEPTTSCRPPRS